MERHITSEDYRAGKRLLLTGRIISTIAAGFWLFIHIVGVFTDDEPWTSEASVLVGLIIPSILATIIGWRRGRLGGALLVAAGIALCIFGYVSAGRNKLIAIGVSGMPFLVAGVMLLVGSAKSR